MLIEVRDGMDEYAFAKLVRGEIAHATVTFSCHDLQIRIHFIQNLLNFIVTWWRLISNFTTGPFGFLNMNHHQDNRHCTLMEGNWPHGSFDRLAKGSSRATFGPHAMTPNERQRLATVQPVWQLSSSVFILNSANAM